MIDFVAGAITALFAVTWGCILHMRYLDKKLLPPPAKPDKGQV